MNRELKCTTKNIFYMIECNLDNCKKHYIGESQRMLKDRISENVGYFRTKKTNIATGEQFNMAGQSLRNMTVTILEKVESEDIFYRK